MCTTCGCSEGAKSTITDLNGDRVEHEYDGHVHAHDGHVHAHEHEHEHQHEHQHQHQHQHPTRIVRLERELLEKNSRLAERNRGWFEGRGILALNLMSAPGAGKTTLLESTIRDLGGAVPLAVIEGDQDTARDAERIRAAGCRVVQVNTGTGCHLDAEMLARAARQLDPPPRSLVLIENVGNLVCPALFDLGEQAKIVVMSVTEGEDKPLKYPHMFRAADVLLLNKIDLLPYLDFDVGRCLVYARRVNPALEVLQVSATRGQGLEAWYGWLRARLSPSSGEE